MDRDKPLLRGLLPEEIAGIIEEHGLPRFRAAQVFKWVQNSAAQNWSDLNNIGIECREVLQERTLFYPGELLRELVSKDGTHKYLWGLKDKNAVETVLLHHTGDVTRNRYTLCLSTQVGCPMGCGFCATGKLGYKRNLNPGEITGQVLDVTAWQREKEPGFKISNLVYMGMGEPLLNLQAVVKSIRVLNHKDGQNIGLRRITVSTCGLIPQIEELAREKLDIVLAVSLHAPNNELRDRIMPVNQKYPLEQLMSACRSYQEKTGRRITFEYALVRGFNDSPEAARQLAALLKGLKANINLIPVNSTDQDRYKPPSRRDVRSFAEMLKSLGQEAVIREEKGADIEAACGMLAGKTKST